MHFSTMFKLEQEIAHIYFCGKEISDWILQLFTGSLVETSSKPLAKMDSLPKRFWQPSATTGTH